jgi:DNA processing protein
LSNSVASDTKPPVSVNSNQIAWLALSLTPGLGPTRAKRLVDFFGRVDAVFNATLTELEAAGLPAQSAQSLATGRSVELAHDEVAKAAAAGVQMFALDDAAYPARLRQIYDPPLVLYVRGNVAALSQPGIAVVGTRHPTAYGTGMAERLACDLATRGLVIFSGLARGVDTAAHRGAVSGKGKTVAVFGTGADVMYPKENSRLAEQMLSLGGALIQSSR